MIFKAYIFDIYGTLFYKKKRDNIDKKELFYKAFLKIEKLIKKRYLNKTIDSNKSLKTREKLKQNIKTNHNNRNNGRIDNLNKIEIDSGSVYEQFLNLVKIIHNEKRENNPDIVQPEIEIRQFWIRFFKLYYNIEISFELAEKISLKFEESVNKIYLPDIGIKLLKLIKKGNSKTKYFFNRFKPNEYLLGIVSNAQFYTEIYLKKFLRIKNLTQYFEPELTFFSYKLGYAKPDPAIYKNLIQNLKRFDIKPEETIFIGNDIKNDIEVPASYGFKTCLINSGKDMVEKDTIESIETKNNIKVLNNNKLSIPDYTVKNLKELYMLFKKGII